MRRAAALLGSLLLPGCAGMLTPPTPPAHVIGRAFSEAEFAAYTRPGAGAIAGQSFLKTRAGDVKYCAGNEVLLVPATDYTTEWFQWSIIAGYSVPVDDRLKTVSRTTIADGEGRFTFDRLPAGDYYLACNVRWEVPSIARGQLRETGGYTYALVRLPEGDSAKVILTDKAPERWFASSGGPANVPLPKLEYGHARVKSPAFEKPTAESHQIATVPKDATVLIEREVGEFLFVRWGIKAGYVRAADVMRSK